MDDGDRIAAQGAPLVLEDGRAVRVRFGMRQLKQLEDTFGSMQGVQDALSSGKTFGSLIAVLAIGTGLVEDDLYDLLHPAKVETYGDAIGAALAEAFPAEAGSGNEPAEGTADSPGPSTTTSAPSPSAVLTAVSG